MVSRVTGGLLYWQKAHLSPEVEIAKNPLLAGLKPKLSELTSDEKIKIIQDFAEECIQLEELRELFASKHHPVCYDGFEPSGRMHIAQALMKAHIVKQLTKCGAVFIFWVADWFSMLNNKFSADLNKIQLCGKYFIEVWKSLGLDMDHVKFLWASEEINKCADQYWMRVMKVASLNTISRIKRCCQIMGRSEGDDQSAATILYPCMQCSDIFQIQADICQLGMDQRKVNMLAREYASQTELKPPIILSHPMLPSLDPAYGKMSKSQPASALFVDDSPQEIKMKLNKSYCPPRIIEGNPCVAYVDRIVFPLMNKFHVKREQKNGGDCRFDTIQQFHQAYLTGDLHPQDLKINLGLALNELLEPVHLHFQNNPEAQQLKQTIQSFT